MSDSPDAMMHDEIFSMPLPPGFDVDIFADPPTEKRARKAYDAFKTGFEIGRVIVAGGYALKQYLKNIGEDTSLYPENDIDLFMLGSSHIEFYRVCDNKRDYVNAVAVTPEDILLNFDLAICRVGYSKDTLYISRNAKMGCVGDKTYIAPSFFHSFNEYKRGYNWKFTTEKLAQEYLTKYFEKVQERIVKYMRRGFTPRFVDALEPTLYMRSRCDVFMKYHRAMDQISEAMVR
jgi:hypothetical protein